MNEILWLVMLLANFSMILLFFRLFGKIGLFLWVPIACIVANIQVVKLVDLFGISATLGNIVYASSFLVTDILSELYGKKEATKAVKAGFLSLLAMTGLMTLALSFTPAPDDFAQKSLTTIFSIMPRIAGASLMAYLVSMSHDVWAFDFWRKRFPQDRLLWLRNNASTLVSQLMDSTIFTLVAFAGVYPANVLWQIFWTTCLLKWIVAAADTPFLYLAKRWQSKEG
ncbi:MAG: hypothetical protein CSB28_00150 [Desulfobacterales bacterium]|nr:MAG: hypothetical protein CSB28_00150 [Desulfobacterales bacterium]